ncbi:hypothetical protein E2C01_065772 [Portunus trituberculatus]|uniref:Uncharacterized protein n=1 Tax=Portunus trituberculatus TaxID=210409 RepID=A0A5B7HSQ4_PORTR|nr:hypothetical protein [Portunus trituberculatus]
METPNPTSDSRVDDGSIFFHVFPCSGSFMCLGVVDLDPSILYVACESPRQGFSCYPNISLRSTVLNFAVQAGSLVAGFSVDSSSKSCVSSSGEDIEER